VETAIASLIQHVAEVRRELVKRHQADAITQATLADLRKTLADIQRLQATFHTMLVKADENFSEGLDQLGRSLLDVVSPQVQAIVKAQEEPKPRPRPPVPPRTQL
jgi:septation ring formation regulator EzrA